MSRIRNTGLACLLALSTGNAVADEQLPLPSHCRAGEFAVANASLGPIIRDRKAGSMRFSRNGKIASLCADRNGEPFGSLAYRYGKPGKVEFERVASIANKFSVYSIQAGNVGSDIAFFSVGSVTYYISLATGMGNGVGVDVFDGDKRVAELFSGNERGVDFEQGPASMTFSVASSPVFQARKPKHRLQ